MTNNTTFLNFLLLLSLTFLLFLGEAQGQLGCPNLVTNGNFQAGDTGFASSLPQACNMCVANSYCVTANFTGKCSGWPSVFDHTFGTAVGRFLAIDGSTTANADVWIQPGVPVTPGVTYRFSFWVATVFGPGQQVFDLGMRINNTTVSTVTISQTVGVWTQYSATWTCPPGLSSVPLAIRQLTGGAFRDFGIDDISFSCVSIHADFACEELGPCGQVSFINQSMAPGNVLYSWDFDDMGNTSSLPNPIYQFSGCGTFNVCLYIVSENGTVASKCKPVTVSDNVAPTALCQPGQGYGLNADCTLPITVGMIDAGSFDNCLIQSMSVSPAVVQGCGFTPITLTVTDWCGNVSTCATEVQTVEVVPPVIVCPPNLQLDCNANLTPDFTGFATATDNCDPNPVIAFSDMLVGLMPCDGAVVRTWTATDDCDNESTCVQTIVVIDNVPPTAVCRSSLSVVLDANCSASITPAMIDNGSDDNCQIQSMTVNPSTFTQCGTFTVTLTVTDLCGNTATCTTSVQVTEIVPPVIMCPPNVQLTCGGPTSPSATGFASATDNCSIPLVTFTDVVTGSQPCDQLIVRTWTAEDDCGNTAACVQTIRVMDDVPPAINCPQSVTVTAVAPDCDVPVHNIHSLGATDNCGTPTVTYTTLPATTGGASTSDASGSVFSVGTTMVTYTATDDCGNMASCSFEVTVECVEQAYCACPGATNPTPNLVANGDFELGNILFTTNLTPNNPCVAGSYTVGSNFTVQCNLWPPVGDHATGTGNFLIVDGFSNTTVPLTIWSQPVNVVPGMTYCFSFWTASVYCENQQDFDLVVTISDANNTPSTIGQPNVVEPCQPPGQPFAPTWINHSFTWTCPAGFTAPYTLSIQQLTPGIFSDFGIDDICFTETCSDTISSVGLTGYFPFYNNTVDYSATAINGILNGPTITSGHDATPNGAYNFDGNDWIDCGLNNRGVTNAVSVAAWVRTSELVNGQWIAGKYDFSADKGYLLAIGDNTGGGIGKVSFSGRDGSGIPNGYHSSGFSQGTVNDGEWHCVVGTAGSDEWRVYVDGSDILANGNSASGSTAGGMSVAANPFTIGRNSDPVISPLWMNGDIDNVLVYNRVLTPFEVDCFCAGVLPVLDTCICGTFTDLNWRPAQGAPNQNIQCGDSLTLGCLPSGFNVNLGGFFNCIGDDCPPVVVNWVLREAVTHLFVGSGTVSGPGFNISLPDTYFANPGVYELFIVGECDGVLCDACMFTIVSEGCVCCTDFAAFCDRIENAVTITVDEDSCKVTLNIGDLPCDDYLEWVNWGDGQQDFGPYYPGDMPMHVYAGSGTYTISYLAIEIDPATGLICFEKELMDTVIIVCPPCATCPNNLVQNPGFFEGAIPGEIGGSGSTNNWVAVAGTPDLSASIPHCDPMGVQMFGSQDAGEAIAQAGFNFTPGKAYSISFSAHFFPAPSANTPYVQFGFYASNALPTSFACAGCETIGISPQITSTGYQIYTLPNWTPSSAGPFNTLIIKALNANNSPLISFGRIDNICIQEVPCAPRPSGMLAWWPMDETGSEADAADIIGSFPATALPGPIGLGGPNPVVGKVDIIVPALLGALEFIGPNPGSHLSVANHSDLNFGNGPFSIDAWINTNMPTQTAPIVDKLANQSSGYSFSIQGTPSSAFPTLAIGTSSGVEVFQGPAITVGQWNFVSVVVDPTSNPPSVTFYVGGDPGGSSPFVSSSHTMVGVPRASNTLPLVIGKNPLNPHWQIKIDELEIFNRALDSLELRQIWAADLLGKCRPDDDCACGMFDQIKLVNKKTGLSQNLSCNNQPPVDLTCPPPGKPYKITGKLNCVPTDCKGTQLYWELRDHVTGLPVASGNQVGPWFSITLDNNVLKGLNGLYDIVLTGLCGSDTCTCVLHFDIAGCPNPLPCPCDNDFGDRVSAGFSYAYDFNNGLCQVILTPVDLIECDVVTWTIQGQNIAFSATGSTTGNQPFTITLPTNTLGNYKIWMKVERPNTPCNLTFCQFLTFNCLILGGGSEICEDNEIPNPGFDQNSVPGILGITGSTEGWQRQAGTPEILDGEGCVNPFSMKITGKCWFIDFDIITNPVVVLPRNGFKVSACYRVSEDDLRPGTQLVFRLSDEPQDSMICVGECIEIARLPILAATGDGWNTISSTFYLEGVSGDKFLTLHIENDLAYDDPDANSTILIDNICLAQNDSAVIVNSNEVLKSSAPLRLHPNPTPGQFTLDLPEPATSGTTLRILSLTGQVLMERRAEVGTAQQLLDASALPAGLYFVQVAVHGKVMGMGKVVRQ